MEEGGGDAAGATPGDLSIEMPLVVEELVGGGGGSLQHSCLVFELGVTYNTFCVSWHGAFAHVRLFGSPIKLSNGFVPF